MTGDCKNELKAWGWSGEMCRGVSLDKKSLFGLNNHNFSAKQVCSLSLVRIIG